MPGSLSLDLVGGDHDRAVGQGLDPVLGADGHRKAPVEDVPDQGDQHVLLLQDVQHLPDGADRVERGRHPGRPADVHLRVVVTAAGPGSGPARPASTIRSTTGSSVRGIEHRMTDRLAGEVGGQMG